MDEFGLEGLDPILRFPRFRDVLLGAEDPHRPAMLLLDIGRQPDPSFPALRRADPDVEREARARADRLAAQPLHGEAGARLVELQGLVAKDGRAARDVEEIVDAIGPGQRLGRQIAFPNADPGQTGDAIIHLPGVGQFCVGAWRLARILVEIPLDRATSQHSLFSREPGPARGAPSFPRDHVFHMPSAPLCSI